MGIICVQDIYKCDTCKSADEYGRNCKHGMLFPLLLVMANSRQCENTKTMSLMQKRQNSI